jgi:hypothetical protein
MTTTEKQNPTQLDSHPLAWGVEEIGKVIGRTARQTHHILTRGQIKSARKVGGKWVANRDALLRELSGDAA